MNDKDIVLLKMPDTEWDIYQAINLNVGKNAFAIVEHVQGYVGSPTTGSQMFNFGWNYGSLRMALFSNHVPFEKVSPGKWQQSFGIAKRGPNETRSKFKNRLKAKAQELFPSVKGITLKTCDALLLVEYARRMKKPKRRRLFPSAHERRAARHLSVVHRRGTAVRLLSHVRRGVRERAAD